MQTVAIVAEAADRQITDTIRGEQSRLRNFIRRRIQDAGDAEDILQDVFYEFVLAYRLMKPIEEAGAWLFRVARNRITDFLRKKRPEPLPPGVDGEPVTRDGPEAAYAHRELMAAMRDALAGLTRAQREVFIAHEMEGRSFKELSAEWGVSVNTLLSRKHYAVTRLREQLRDTYNERTGK